MSTSEQTAWAKAEAEKKWGTRAPDGTPASFVSMGAVAAAEWAFLHVLSLLESETAVEAATEGMESHYDRWSGPGEEPPTYADLAEVALAAAVGAITNQETGGSR